MSLEDWLSNVKKVSNYLINISLSKNAAAKADKGIQKKVKELLSRKIGDDAPTACY